MSNAEIADLIARIELVPLAPADEAARVMREEARALVRAVLSFHGDAMTKIVQAMESESPALLAKLRADPLIASVLELHDLDSSEAPAALVPASSLVRKKEKEKGNGKATNEHANCDLCGVAISTHAHLLELGSSSRSVRCACAACALLFDSSSAAKYRRIPSGVRALAIDDGFWDALGLPSGMAFIVARESGEASAWYPSMFGATESKISSEVWTQICARYPQKLEPEVEAIVVDRLTPKRSEQYVVGIDRCWALVARIRSAWQGMTGGAQVREEVSQFFRELSSAS
jgi:hypothetical protein